MLIFKKRTSPESLVAELCEVINRHLLAVYDGVCPISQVVNPERLEKAIGLNVITSLFAIACASLHPEKGPDKYFWENYTLLEKKLESMLEKHGASDPKKIAAYALENQMKMYVMCVMGGGNPLWETSKAFLYSTSGGGSVPSDALISSTLMFLTPFLSELSNLLHNKRI